MPSEPPIKRTRAYIDGQKLFHGAKEAFGYSYPNYDIKALVTKVCQAKGWQIEGIHFYTGIPDAEDNAFWNHFWTTKLSGMGRQGIKVFSRPLRYRNETVSLPGGMTHTFLVGQEKGVDIRIALDIVRAVRLNECDVALVFSQDQDLSEVADEVRTIAKEHDRWVRIASAFPFSPTTLNRRGVNSTDWIRIDRAMYDSCLDPHDYRLKKV
ncbi:MAG: NYN domain-containing protein [Chitinivibrionales bacterium]|nr:NYN domain-containing protein [Chitinivibrionales bacterium]